MARKPPYKHVPLEERPEFLAALAKLEGIDQAEFPELARAQVAKYHDAVLIGDVVALDEANDAYEALVFLLNGGTTFGSRADENSAGNVLGRATAAQPGRVPCWGQAGEFLLEVEGMRLWVAIDDGLSNHRPVTFEVVDLDRPFLSATGHRRAMITAASNLGLTVDQAVKNEALSILNTGKTHSVKLDFVTETKAANRPAWLVNALAGVHADGQLAMFGDAPLPSKPAPKSNAARQKALRERRKAQQLKPILLSHTERCVLSLGLLAHEDLDHRQGDWETSKKPEFDALLKKLWPEGDNGRYLAEPQRSTYRPAAYLRNELERQRGIAERASAELDRVVSANGAEDLRRKVAALEKENALLESERNKAHGAIALWEQRLRNAGLSTDYRRQPGE